MTLFFSTIFTAESVLVSDNHCYIMQVLQGSLDSGKSLPFPDGILINGQAKTSFTGDQGNLVISFEESTGFYPFVKRKTRMMKQLVFFVMFFQARHTGSGFQTSACQPRSTLGFRAT